MRHSPAIWGEPPAATGPDTEVDAMGITRRFVRDEKGAIAIEFTLLVPLFVLLMVFFVDASTIYLTHSEMYNVARDISRRMSTGELTNDAEVQAYAADHLFLARRTYNVSTHFRGDKMVAIYADVVDSAIFGVMFKQLLGQELIALAVTAEEPRI